MAERISTVANSIRQYALEHQQATSVTHSWYLQIIFLENKWAIWTRVKIQRHSAHLSLVLKYSKTRAKSHGDESIT
jgi:hypothetical protein